MFRVAWLERLGERSDESLIDKERRGLSISMCFWWMVAAMFILLAMFAGSAPVDTGLTGMAVLTVVVTSTMVLLLFSPFAAVDVCTAAMLAVTPCVLGLDLSNASYLYPRNWNLMVIVLDMTLVLGFPDWTHIVFVGFTLIYLSVERVAAVTSFGLYSAASFGSEPSLSDIPVCNCPSPPCSIPWTAGFNSYAGFFVVFVTDFALTRGFAVALRRQHTLVAASVEVAQQVAVSLASFDLDHAKDVLHHAQAGETLPEGLYKAFSRLLRNLASYRPYLPQSCFERVGEMLPEESRDDHSTGDGRAESPALSSTHLGPGRRVSFRRQSSLRQSVRSGLVHSETESSMQQHDSDPASDASSGSLTPLPGRGHNIHAPSMRRVTLLCSNTSAFLAAVRADPDSTPNRVAAEVALFSTIVKDQGGVTDLLAGDHLSASFGAVKAQGSQCNSATRAAMQLAAAPPAEEGRFDPLPHTAAVCTGRALCGDFGSTTTQRFMVIGGVSSFLQAVERVAAAWGFAALIDAAVHKDAEQLWTCRLRKYARFLKLTARPVGLWEVLEQRMEGGEGAEWMYELENAQPNPWEPYNAAVALWNDSGHEKALAVVAAALAEQGPGAAELRALQGRLQEGAPPPLVDLCPAAIAGDPAPVATLCGDA